MADVLSVLWIGGRQSELVLLCAGSTYRHNLPDFGFRLIGRVKSCFVILIS